MGIIFLFKDNIKVVYIYNISFCCRVSQWSAHNCGIVILNVQKSDSGHWRLTSSNAAGSLARGVVILRILGLFDKMF